MRDEKLASVLAQFPKDYTLVNADGTEWAGNGQIQALGEGGSSIVLRALYRNRLPRAVKIMIPRDDFVASDSGAEHFKRSFENEKDALSELSHERIARITDFDEVNTDEFGAFPYVAMELVDGLPLRDWAQQDAVSGEDIITALHQVLDAVEYLHHLKIMHSDIKEDNVIVRSGDNGSARVRACLVDLGVSHDLREVGADLGGSHVGADADDYIYFFSTREYVIPDLQLVLGNKSHNRILKSDLRKHFPWQDLYSLGKVIENLVSLPQVSKKIREVVGYGGLQALSRIASGLTVGLGDRHVYPSVASLKLAVSRISTSALAPLGESLLSQTGSKGIVIPGSGRLVIPRYFDKVVSHPMFQRLHHLPQLDLLQYVLPGATHSRFPHALREMELARNAINQQLHNWEFRIAVRQEDIVKTLLGALLNSVGRYQLHHMFEDYLPYRGRVASAGLLDTAEVQSLLLGADGGSGPLAELTKDGKGRTISELIGLPWSEVRALRQSPADPVQGFLAGLLDSPLDVNKLAYLRADSEATGVRFGLGLNAEALFEYMRLARFEDWQASSVERRSVLGLGEDGISYAENAIMTRYWNIQTTYWNRINRALQSMVKFVIGSLLASKRFSFEKYLGDTLHGPTNDALMLLSREFDNAVAAGVVDDSAVNPLKELQNSERNAYRRLLTISPKSSVESRVNDAQIYQLVSSQSPLLDADFAKMIAGVLNEVVPGVNPRPGEILLDVPRARREESEGKVLVYSDPPDTAYLGDLSQASPVLNNLTQSFELYVKRLRVFIHPRIHALVLPKSEQVHKALLTRLRADAKAGVLL